MNDYIKFGFKRGSRPPTQVERHRAACPDCGHEVVDTELPGRRLALLCWRCKQIWYTRHRLTGTSVDVSMRNMIDGIIGEV